MEIIREKGFIEGFWAIDEFLNAYQQEAEDGLVACALAVEGDGNGNPDETAIAVLRVAIQKSARALSDQKFVVGVSFYGFGDMMTIDVVSFDEDFHRDNIYEHAKRLNCVMPHTAAINKFDLSYHVPFIYGGAHLQVKDDDIETSGTSQDFGNRIFTSDAVALADFTIKACGLPSSADTSSGEAYVQSLLDFMKANKLQPDFYEQLIEDQASKGARFTSQHFGGLLAIKASDRVKKGEGDILQILVEELADGITRTFMIASLLTKQQSQ